MQITEAVEQKARQLENEAREMRQRAEWGDDYAYRKVAADLIEQWCRDPEMWATHGLPGEGKLHRLEIDIAAALKKAAV